MTTILVLDCDLFPDRETLDAALETLQTTHDIRHLDIRELGPDDDEAWAAAARAVMDADHVITQ